MKHELNGSQK